MSTPNLVRPSYSVFGLVKTLESTLTRFLAACDLKIIALIIFSYFLTGELGIQLANPVVGATAIWLPAGISLAVVLLRGNRVWPGIFIGAFLLNLADGLRLPVSLGTALTSTLEALLAAYLVNKFAYGTRAFFKSRNVLRFVFFAAILSTALCTSFGVFFLRGGSVANWPEFLSLWRIWWIGDTLGILLLTPFLVLLFGHRHHSLSLAELLEVSILLVGLSIVCILNFGPPLLSWMPQSGLHYLCIPFLAWAALRFCPLEAAGATMVFGGFALWGSLHGFGIFADASKVPFFGAGYVAIISVTTLVVAASFAHQRQCLEDALCTYYLLKEKYDREVPTLEDSLDSSNS
jgi:integral membrane sensor domain MASE1